MAIKQGGNAGADPGHIIVAAAMVGDIARYAIDIRELEYIAFSFTWTGAAVGTLKIEVSNDYLPQADFQSDTTKALRLGHWSDATAYFDTLTQPSNNAGTIISQTKVPLAFKYIAVSYTHSSSSGSLDVFYNAKGV